MIKKAIIFSVLFASAGSFGNPARAQQIQSFIECSKIADNISRLACFDRAAQKISGAVATHDSPPTRKQEINNFGKQQLRASPVRAVREAQKTAEKKELKDIRLKVVKHVYTSTRKFVLFMENGQVWKQKDDGRIRLPGGEFYVEIKKGMIGGYNMIVPTRKSLVKVKRLR